MRSAGGNFGTGIAGSDTHSGASPSAMPPAPRTSVAGRRLRARQQLLLQRAARLQPASRKTRPCSGPTPASRPRRAAAAGCRPPPSRPRGGRQRLGLSGELIDRPAAGPRLRTRVTPVSSGARSIRGVGQPGPGRALVQPFGEGEARPWPASRGRRGPHGRGGRRRCCGSSAAARGRWSELARLPCPSALPCAFILGPAARTGPRRSPPGRRARWWRSGRAARTARAHAACTAASTIGSSGPAQPAITALIATFSTVAAPP